MNKAYKLSLWILQQDPDNESGLAPRAVRGIKLRLGYALSKNKKRDRLGAHPAF
jgi:hypothetical protein